MVQSSLSQGLTKTNLFQTTAYDGWNRTETKNDITLIEKNSVMMIKSLKKFQLPNLYKSENRLGSVGLSKDFILLKMSLS